MTGAGTVFHNAARRVRLPIHMWTGLRFSLATAQGGPIIPALPVTHRVTHRKGFRAAGFRFMLSAPVAAAADRP